MSLMFSNLSFCLFEIQELLFLFLFSIWSQIRMFFHALKKRKLAQIYFSLYFERGSLFIQPALSTHTYGKSITSNTKI